MCGSSEWYVAEHDGSSGASGIGTHCADAESMRGWYPHRSQWDRYPLTASTRYEWDGCPSWMQVYSVFDHSQRLLRRWDWYPLLAGVHKVAEQDGSFGVSGIGTHCADAEFM